MSPKTRILSGFQHRRSGHEPSRWRRSAPMSHRSPSSSRPARPHAGMRPIRRRPPWAAHPPDRGGSRLSAVHGRSRSHSVTVIPVGGRCSRHRGRCEPVVEVPGERARSCGRQVAVRVVGVGGTAHRGELAGVVVGVVGRGAAAGLARTVAGGVVGVADGRPTRVDDLREAVQRVVGVGLGAVGCRDARSVAGVVIV